MLHMTAAKLVHDGEKNNNRNGMSFVKGTHVNEILCGLNNNALCVLHHLKHTPMAKVAIIYYSQTGTTHKLAQAIEEGAKAAGAETRLLRVKETAPDELLEANQAWKQHRESTSNVAEATNDDLEWADAIIFGTPTRYGLPSAQLKNFIDHTGALWAKGALTN
jgi:flavorubredoxin